MVATTYILGRRWNSLNYVSWPVAFGAMSLVPPATGISFSSWWVVNLLFNGIIRRRKPAWWSKYSMYIFSPLFVILGFQCSLCLDYVLSAALDCGVAVSTVIIFFCITLPVGSLSWWGNVISSTTADGKGTPYKGLPDRGYFGPPKGTWD